MHTDLAFREYLAWYQRVMWIKLHQRWTDDDYTDVGSSADEDTPYDMRTWEGSHVELGPVLDHVVCFVSTLYDFCDIVSLCQHIDCSRMMRSDDLSMRTGTCWSCRLGILCHIPKFSFQNVNRFLKESQIF
jgi:hypothetical protein